MHGIRLHISGDLALFTRAEMKVERVSYDVITPSAARGVLEAIYWKPQIRWQITRIHVLRPIRFMSLRRNEVSSKITVKGAAGAKAAMKSGRGQLGIYVEDFDERVQRAATVLRNVAYVLEARFEIVDGEENPGKHLDQFNRRAAAGQCFHRPYLGCREFHADFHLLKPGDALPEAHTELQGERDLGWMLHDIEYVPDPAGPIIEGNRGEHRRAEPRFFRASMRNGVIDVPPLHTEGVRS